MPVDNNGEDGERGNDGPKVPDRTPAMNGPDGRYSFWGGVIAQRGDDGLEGFKGNDGRNGLRGGDAGDLMVDAASYIAGVTYQAKGGKGGAGGNGGVGGNGQAGGNGGAIPNAPDPATHPDRGDGGNGGNGGKGGDAGIGGDGGNGGYLTVVADVLTLGPLGYQTAGGQGGKGGDVGAGGLGGAPGQGRTRGRPGQPGDSGVVPKVRYDGKPTDGNGVNGEKGYAVLAQRQQP